MKCKDCLLKPFFDCSKCKEQTEYQEEVKKFNDKYKAIKEKIDELCVENNLSKVEKKTMLDKIKSIIFKNG
ncbi:MAG: hypothetical protein PVF17_00785 [Ignavibacteria bacterium]